MNKKKILLIGASLESENKGVNALGIGAISLLMKNYNGASISLLCVGKQREKVQSILVGSKNKDIKTYYYSKEQFIKSLLESYVNRLFPSYPSKGISSLIASSDIVFDINEGDSFSDIYGLKRIIRHFTDSKLILSWKKPLVFLPQTIGPFNTIFGKLLAKHILKRLNKLYVRDNKAVKFLNKINIKEELSIDMAVYMEPKDTAVQIKPNTVGINVSGLMYLKRYKSLKGMYDEYPEFLNKLIQKVLENGFEVILIPHTYNPTKPNTEDDLEGIKKFITDYPNLANLISYVNNEYSAQELKNIISKTVFFLGSRMHSCIAALSSSVPTIGLSYSYKFEGTFSMFGQKAMVYDINRLKSEDINGLVDKISFNLKQRKEIASELKRTNQRKALSILAEKND